MKIILLVFDLLVHFPFDGPPCFIPSDFLLLRSQASSGLVGLGWGVDFDADTFIAGRIN